MLTIGPLEFLVILVVALLVVGPKRLPEVGRSIGRALREFRRAQEEVQRTISLGLEETPSTSGPPQEPTTPDADPPNRESLDPHGEPTDDPPPTPAEGEG